MDKPTLMEPMLPSSSNPRFRDLENSAVDLVANAASLAGCLPAKVRLGIADLVRSMNCYYSNLIEGHNTHPRDIDSALNDDYSGDEQKRNLQYEARAHIDLQSLIDHGDDLDEVPTSVAYIRWLHHEFCRQLPDALLWVEHPTTGARVQVIPGALRDGDVQVGRHIAPQSESLPRFLARFEQAYASEQLSKIQSIIAVAAAHHRLLWIHPFFDGNGRVARLLSHTMLMRCGIGSSLWSVARGLARQEGRYKTALALADEPRHGDLDGRGTLSERRLCEFCQFFLQVCNDQITFMKSLLQPTELMRRITLYVNDEVDANRLPKGSLGLLRAAFLSGEVARGRASELTGYQERRGRQILATLLEKGLLVSEGPKAPVRLGFPLDVIERWLPKLYPVD